MGMARENQVAPEAGYLAIDGDPRGPRTDDREQDIGPAKAGVSGHELPNFAFPQRDRLLLLRCFHRGLLESLTVPTGCLKKFCVDVSRLLHFSILQLLRSYRL
jgi:hypothetical protein